MLTAGRRAALADLTLRRNLLAAEYCGTTRRLGCHTLRLLGHQGLNIAIFLAVVDNEPIELGADEPGPGTMLVIHRDAAISADTTLAAHAPCLARIILRHCIECGAIRSTR